ncbi:hypothetical protein BH10BAC5_BH10BAC5_07120 [soil metagenome]
MNSSKDLFNLISSLTKSEKRYFTASNRTGSVYLKLFHEIERQSAKGIYDEKAIKDKYKDEKFIRQLTYTKNYLYSLISDNLIRYHNKNNIESYIYSLITSAKIFFTKSLFENYFKNIEKAKLLAEKYERFGILIELIALQKHLIRAKDLNRIKLSTLQKEEETVVKRIKNIDDYSKLFGTLNILIKRLNISGSRTAIITIEKILEDKLLSSEKYTLSVQAKDIYYDLKIYSADFNNIPEDVIELLLRKKENYAANEEIFKMNVNFQLSTITYNLAAIYLEQKNIPEFEKHFNFYKDLKAKDNITGLLNDLEMNSLLLKFIFLNRDSSDFKKYAESVLKYANENQDKITKDYLLSIYYNISVLQFESGDIESSLNTLNILMNHRFKNFRKDLLSAAKLLSLFIHYELGNIDLLENLLRSLKRNKNITSTQIIIAEHLTQLINPKNIHSPKNKKLKIILSDLRFGIQKLKKDRFEKHIFRYFDPEPWIVKKINL